MKLNVRKTTASIMALLITASMTACGEPKPSQVPDETPAKTEATTPAVTTEVTPEVIMQYPVAEKFGLSPENLPKMDGSTSAIPLEAGLRAALFGLSQEDAELQVVHTTTHGSFEKLINGECDLIFTVPISEDQKQAAKDKGVELEMIPIAAEGFVFIVNADNPVKSITQQEVRDIYSGKITNWKELGGNDSKILAYQRNIDSGSQNYMTVFMGDTPMAKAPTELIMGGMAGILDAIAVYDNGEDAIGYSVYSYAMDMYNQKQNIRAVAIDGVEATKENMENGTYPLLSVSYLMFRADEPEDSPVRKFAEFVKSEEGQTAIKNAGYIPAEE